MCLEGNTSLVSTIHLCQGRWVARTCVSSGFQDGLTHLLTSTISYGCTFFHIYFASPSCDIKIQLKTSVPSSSIGRQAISQRQTVSGTPEEALLLTYFFYHLSLLSTHMRNYVVYFIWHVCVCSERKGLNLCLFLQFVYVITRNLDYIWPHQSTNRLTQKDLRFLSWATEGGGGVRHPCLGKVCKQTAFGWSGSFRPTAMKAVQPNEKIPRNLTFHPRE